MEGATPDGPRPRLAEGLRAAMGFVTLSTRRRLETRLDGPKVLWRDCYERGEDKVVPANSSFADDFVSDKHNLVDWVRIGVIRLLRIGRASADQAENPQGPAFFPDSYAKPIWVYLAPSNRSRLVELLPNLNGRTEPPPVHIKDCSVASRYEAVPSHLIAKVQSPDLMYFADAPVFVRGHQTPRPHTGHRSGSLMKLNGINPTTCGVPYQ